MRKALAVLTVLCALALSACTSGDGAGSDVPEVQVDEHSKISIDDGRDTAIYEITLTDGTKCVVWDAYRSGGLWCSDGRTDLTQP